MYDDIQVPLAYQIVITDTSFFRVSVIDFTTTLMFQFNFILDLMKLH